MPAASNVLIIMSDEHNKAIAGCYGNRVVATPNIDALAARGTLFEAAYTNCPVCVPARASFACGRYVHDIGHWDNADPYDGTRPSWHHILRAGGHEVSSIGKLHFRSAADDYGFTQSLIPMHVVEEKGDLLGLVRDELPKRKGSWKMARLAGPGESSYTFYDRDIAARAQTWLREAAARPHEKPWVLFVSFVAPHFPLTAPPEHYYRYYDDPNLEWPKLYEEEARPAHPYLREYAECFAYDEHFASRDDVRRALAGYYGLVGFLDENIGKLLKMLEATGLSETTRVVYVSDHGDNLGARGLWGKSTMYEEAVSVPLIAAGPGLGAGEGVKAPVSLVDLSASILSWAGEDRPADWPGEDLAQVARERSEGRVAFAEYHGMGSKAGFYMLRDGRYKYVHYVDHPAQLFDLEADPQELNDLAGDPAHSHVLGRLRAELYAICDPDDTDLRAKARQGEQLRLAGGREAVIARGDLGFSPPPGFSPDFNL
ncbi:sulfatase-like hydrolase/transferase [Ancylobacter mangrovi]|uniref:sulfatase-like hydrolase/transferase n=1 Tax=Ancylobacter mangrovi TaxID=2972472 RepID=UPI002161790A|nr:sulfatase-like hydrolase/transferase [Ancylobacter mangrovi]MCS0501551.1 sulfatase-like hydrolase/transferase [Ancylobacter mangrovi]